MIIRIEFEWGTDLWQAFAEAYSFAQRNDTTVIFDFNGVRCHVAPSGDCETGIKNYMYAIGHNIKSVNNTNIIHT